MATHPERILEHVRALARDPSLEPATDAQLLERYVRGNDDAFADIVCRYGPVVIGVCRRVLHDRADAEDVAQAVFLVLARQARSIRRPDALAGWLYKTARRLALNHRRDALRRLQRETRGFLATPTRAVADPLDELSVRELLAIFDEELQRLPECYRLPLILCCLEGCTQEEAARRLGWMPRSVKGRLERGRQRLRERLVRRGVSMSAVLVGVEAARAADMTADFITATTQAALHFSTGASAADTGLAKEVVTLAESWLRSTAMYRVKIVFALLLIVGALTAGVAAVAPPPAGGKPRVEKELWAEETEADRPRERVDRHGDPLPAGAVARLGTVRWRTDGDIDALAFTPDGKAVIAGTRLGHLPVRSRGQAA